MFCECLSRLTLLWAAPGRALSGQPCTVIWCLHYLAETHTHTHTTLTLTLTHTLTNTHTHTRCLLLAHTADDPLHESVCSDWLLTVQGAEIWSSRWSAATHTHTKVSWLPCLLLFNESIVGMSWLSVSETYCKQLCLLYYSQSSFFVIAADSIL